MWLNRTQEKSSRCRKETIFWIGVLFASSDLCGSECTHISLGECGCCSELQLQCHSSLKSFKTLCLAFPWVVHELFISPHNAFALWAQTATLNNLGTIWLLWGVKLCHASHYTTLLSKKLQSRWFLCYDPCPLFIWCWRAVPLASACVCNSEYIIIWNWC